MLAKVSSAVNEGLESHLVEVETDVSSGFPVFEIVGLPDKAVSEAKERVRSAIINSGFKFLPGNKKRLIVNLAPADIKKEGSIYDLPIALGILLASDQIPLDEIRPACRQVRPHQDLTSQQTLQVEPVRKLVEESLFVGELSLDGKLRHTRGVLPMALLAKKSKIKNIYLPEVNAQEAGLVEGLNIYPLKSLNYLLEYFSGQTQITPFKSKSLLTSDINSEEYEFDFGYIKGQGFVKRALEIAAAGGHNVLMIGVPGSGKTLLARAIPSILPRMNKEEILQATKIYSVAGLLKEKELLKSQRPFRSPHHTISDVAMVGGGQIPRPGEVSLAHRGVLFLDELTHFSRMALESLRQPLEDGEILVARARGSVSYPSKFILIASMNPCPCGYYGDQEKECRCGAGDIIRYRRKISGPFLDRIDLHLSVPRVKIDKLMSEKVAEGSEKIRQRVEKARQSQKKRFSSSLQGSKPSARVSTKTMTNAEMTILQIKEFCQLDQAGEKLLKDALEKFVLSARAYHRILKVARTIADLVGSNIIGVDHIAESIQYRTKVDENIFS